MYPLGKQFQENYQNLTSNPNCVFKGANYRITILTERLVRLEYDPSGKFVDVPSQLVKNRNFSVPEFKVKQDASFLEITTRYFILSYFKGQPFVGSNIDPMKNLKITLVSNDKDRERSWYYGHPEARNATGNMIAVDVQSTKAQNRGLYSFEGFVSIDDSYNKLIEMDGTLVNRVPGSLDIYAFFYDKDFHQALNDYYQLTGYPDLIPRYALGNWWCRNTLYNDQSIEELLKKFEKKKIPISILLLDNDWHYRNVGEYVGLKSGFTFNQSLFPNPTKTIQEIHNRNIRIGLKLDPSMGIFPHEAGFATAQQYLGLSEAKIVLFDPLNPKLLDVYLKVFLHPLEAMGIDFFWNDYSGNNNLTNLWAINHYQYLDSGREVAKRPLVLSRGSIYAPHKNSILYAGSSEVSWENLKKLPLMLSNAANIGVSWWSHDVAGNHGGVEDPELYIRHVQLGVFSPIFRYHAARGPYYKREPWLWDVKTETITANYLRLRHRLIPYIYSEAYNYHKTGTPLIQPLYHNYPWIYDDVLYRNQYYFGSQLLVAPILEKKDIIMNRTVHRFFIPDGIWYDFTTGKKFPGARKYISFFRDEDYPVFAHAGSIIPLSNRSDRNNTGISTDMEIHIFPGVSNTYTLYDDDGITSLYKEGYYLKTSIDYNYLRNNYTVIIRSIEGKSGIVPEKRNYKLVFRNTREAIDVSAFHNASPLTIRTGVDGNDFVVEVIDAPTIGQVTVNCKGHDIEIDAVRVINDDFDSILMDLQINTYLKEEIAKIMFGDDSIKKKRIAVRKLRKKGLSREYMSLFLKLLEYIAEV